MRIINFIFLKMSLLEPSDLSTVDLLCPRPIHACHYLPENHLCLSPGWGLLFLYLISYLFLFCPFVSCSEGSIVFFFFFNLSEKHCLWWINFMKCHKQGRKLFVTILTLDWQFGRVKNFRMEMSLNASFCHLSLNAIIETFKSTLIPDSWHGLFFFSLLSVVFWNFTVMCSGMTLFSSVSLGAPCPVGSGK